MEPRDRPCAAWIVATLVTLAGFLVACGAQAPTPPADERGGAQANSETGSGSAGSDENVWYVARIVEVNFGEAPLELPEAEGRQPRQYARLAPAPSAATTSAVTNHIDGQWVLLKPELVGSQGRLPMRLIAERINHDEDYGFDYTIGYEGD